MRPKGLPLCSYCMHYQRGTIMADTCTESTQVSYDAIGKVEDHTFCHRKNRDNKCKVFSPVILGLTKETFVVGGIIVGVVLACFSLALACHALL